MIDLEQQYYIVQADGNIQELALKDILSRSEKTLLYFYPKDATPGCTAENKDFSQARDGFKKAGIQLIGVSKDSIDSHALFMDEHNLHVDLISDTDLRLHNEFGAYGEKNNYGTITEGVIRSTFLLDRDGEILEQWKGIKARGHVERVMNQLRIR